jgi:hypothetical protein
MMTQSGITFGKRENTHMFNSTAHNFTTGAAIRRNTPLSLDDIRCAAPSAFATEAYHDRSNRYAYIPTSAVIEGMMSNGFMPFQASQSRTKIEDKREHTKHMIRFRAPNASLVVGDSFPEIVLINSHDGSSAYKLMAGIFRLVCSNGLVVADSMIESIHVRHSGNIIAEVSRGTVELVENMPKCIDAIERWKGIQLDRAQQTAYAEAAHHVRFADSDGHVNTPIRPEQLLGSRRYDDKGQDLWSTFNRVQENVIKGGISARANGAARRTGMREVKGIDQDVKLNRALWMLAEKMAEIRG